MNESDVLGSRRAIFAWLWLLIAMVFGMVVVGGVTRLTGSGLSIVEWAPILGTLPPLNHADWMAAFGKYQQYPQYRITHPDMTLAEFQGIFFWEYVHRLLGRLVGMVFLLPFLWFWLRGCLSARLRGRLLVALGLGALQGLMGWLMVKSGLVDEPRVSHFRLAAHLGLAFSIMAYLFWVLLQLRGDAARAVARAAAPRVLLWSVAALTVLQIVYGAFVAGLRYGEGRLHTKNAGSHKVFWQGPSIGYDFGGAGAKTMVLVYNLRDPSDVFHRFGGVEGTAYLVGGVSIQFLKYGDVTMAPIRAGVGLRLGANIGYLKYTRSPTWNPF